MDRILSARNPLLWVLIGAVWLLSASASHAQQIDPEGRLVAEVRIEGLETTPRQLVENQIRTEAGRPYSADVISADIERLEMLGRFAPPIESTVSANADGSLIVTFKVNEEPALAGISFTGNKKFNTTQLMARVLLRQGDPIDRALIDRGATAIEQLYESAGYFATSVSIDEAKLTEDHVLVFRVVEGPRVRIVDIRFEGNTRFNEEALDPSVKSEPYFFWFQSGNLDRSQLDRDAAAIRQYYQDRGFLEADVGRVISQSPNMRDAVVTFQIKEGPQYTVNAIDVRFTQQGQPTDQQVFSHQQIPMFMPLERGGIFSDDLVGSSANAIRHLYGELGYIDASVEIERIFDREQHTVDVIVKVEEGPGATTIGRITVIGNDHTRIEEVLHRVVGIRPGRPVNTRGYEQTLQFVRESALFTGGRVTLLGQPGDPVRDVLIEINERNTGSFNFFVGLNSDLGVSGGVTLSQRNFDITDFPESLDEFLSGKAFIGDGQRFSMTVSPGTDSSLFEVSFREPHLFNSDYFFDINLRASQFVREDFDEGRNVARVSVGRRLGDVWTGSVNFRFENVDIDDIDTEAPVDVFAVSGSNTLTSAGFSLTRSDTDSNIIPSRGSRITIAFDQYGALGGDYNFSKINANYNRFWTLDEDFLGRKSILSFGLQAGYIFDDFEDVPLFERFNAGGRNFRGFEFRGIGPRGIRNDTMVLGDDPVGGNFRLVTRLEYEIPFYEDNVRWAVFLDQGTVDEDFDLSDWRVSAGMGFRFLLPFFGQAPVALDFAVPILKEDGDETEFFSFSVDLPFN